MEQRELSLTVAGTENDICMIEAGAKQVSEQVMLDALEFGQKAIQFIPHLIATDEVEVLDLTPEDIQKLMEMLNNGENKND